VVKLDQHRPQLSECRLDDSASLRADAGRRAAHRTEPRSTTLSVVVPATDEPASLQRALPPIREALHPGEELIVVTRPGGAGPAEARNAGAEQAAGEVLVFVDADVVVHPDALTRLRAAFDRDAGLTAVFGSYDDGPTSPAVVSQFRNLLHHYIHQSCPGPAQTFWAGIGAVRREEFLALGGFDDRRYPVPSVEDIELGARIVAAGGRVELHPKVQGTHLKHWTLARMIRTDFLLRGIPWVEMCLESRTVPRSLNLSWRERTSTLLTVLAVPALGLRRRRLLGWILLGLAACDARFLWLVINRMGPPRAVVGVGLHGLHRLIGVAAVPAGLIAHVRARRADGRG
jgi:GT2 family glycosyltransferase